jgi:peptide/nickel transport system permease protein
MKVFKYLVAPLLLAAFIFLTTTFIVYQLINLAPGLPSQGTAVQIGTYWTFVGNVLNDQFGTSFRTNQPVIEIFRERLPASLDLFIPTVLGSLLFGLPLGVLMAYFRRRLTDGFLRPFAWLGASLPVFWVGLMLILIYGIQQGRFPGSGSCSSGGDSCFDQAEHLFLPLLTLLIAWTPVVALYVRGALLKVLDKPDTASTGKQVVDGILLPLLAALPIFFAGVTSSLILVESVFAWPGVGRLAAEAAVSLDFPMLTATVMIPARWNIVALLVFSLVSGLILLLRGDPDEGSAVAAETPLLQTSVPESPVGLFADEAAEPPTNTRPLIDKLYTLAAIIAALVLVGTIVVSFTSANTDAFQVDPANRLLPPGTEAHPLGTDNLGHDNLARLLEGGKTTLLTAFKAAVIALVIGSVVGFVGGLFMDSIGVVLNIPINIVVIALNLMPVLPLLLLGAGIFRPDQDGIAWMLGLVGWGSTVPIIRVKVAELFNPKVKAPSWGTWLGLIIFALATNMIFSILGETSLSFLGLGVQPPSVSWGTLIAEARNALTQADYLLIPPGLLITGTVFCLYVITSRIRDQYWLGD